MRGHPATDNTTRSRLGGHQKLLDALREQTATETEHPRHVDVDDTSDRHPSNEGGHRGTHREQHPRGTAGRIFYAPVDLRDIT